MANVIISGSAVTLKSAIKAVSLKKVQSLKPAWLVEKDEKNNELFRIAFDNKVTGSATAKGVSFDKKDRSGYAMVTWLAPVNLEEKSDAELQEMFAPIVLPLVKMEKAIGEKMPSLNEELNSVGTMITVLAAPTVATDETPEPAAE